MAEEAIASFYTLSGRLDMKRQMKKHLSYFLYWAWKRLEISVQFCINEHNNEI